MMARFTLAEARHRAVMFAVLLLLAAVSVRAQAPPETPPRPQPPTPAGMAERSGQQIYESACETCHGPDGKGASVTTVGFTAPLPDFTDCAFATAEPDPDWQAVVHEGGPIRGLDRHMPAFGEALTGDCPAGRTRCDWPN